ncbi:leucyl aminopeptidase family protein [Mesonia ostreae]|uniref:Leucyl aminopeptidase n=1 Tax=Mesonia ostreae TaxID=861110 RepID=A0ABU2KI89_9FLAO|nr:leucyl aminopeptidase [Mesonia ostreae]MDT0294438.1 leucyl aminopeptidase [Mesonia ostreae]
MNSYHLYLDLVSLDETENNSEKNNSILLLSTAEQLQKKSFNPIVTQKIKTAFQEEKDSVISYVDDTQNFLVSITSTDIEKNRTLGIALYKALEKEHAETSQLRGLKNLSPKQQKAFLEGLVLGSYHFGSYLKKQDKKNFSVNVPSQDFTEAAVQEVLQVAKAVALTRTLVNEPPNKLDSVMFSERIIQAGKDCGFKTETLHKEEIENLGMGGLLGVNQGSEVPPTFNIMTYQPKNAVNTSPLVLVGKGVTFDTGGYSLKVGGSMSTMKADMGGGATVVGIMAAVALNQLPYHVIGIVPATDNKIDGNALLVDDVITMMDGTSVEIQNTDAEGRLILADALTYAKRYHPNLVIDIATLTGAAAAITGSFGIAMAGNQQEKMNHLKKSGDETYERLIQLPFWKEYGDLLKSEVADLKNIGGPIGGATTAAKFLEHFTNYDWIHLDIAGPAFLKEAKGSLPSGGTGVGVRLVYNYIQNQIHNKA